MKSLSALSTLIALTFTILPAWGVTEGVTEPAAAKQEVKKKHHSKKHHHSVSKAVPSIAPASMIAPAATPVFQAATSMAKPVETPPPKGIAAPALPSTPPVAATNPYLQAPPIQAVASPVVAVQPVVTPAVVTQPIVAQPIAAQPTVAPAVVAKPESAPIAPAAVAALAQRPTAVIVQPLPPLPGNPYLQPVLVRPVAANPAPSNFFPAFSLTPYGSLVQTLPVLVLPGWNSINDMIATTKSFIPRQLSDLLPGGDPGASHWPISFSVVYPTGEKPLAVLTLKCPTEAAFGIAPPPVKLVHIVLSTAMDGINYTGLLPFNLQQVCQ